MTNDQFPIPNKGNILYLFSDTGGGHRAGAKALISAVETLKPSAYNQKMVDVFAQCSGFLNIFANMYGPLTKYAPWLWGTMYFLLDDDKRIKFLETISKPFILDGIKTLIKTENPDVIVSVHPLVNHLTCAALKELGLKTPFIVVVMDPFTLHRAWITPDPDLYIVATEKAKQFAIKYGAPEQKIKVRGMPIDPKFAEGPQHKEELRIKDGLDPKRFTIMLMGGGEGSGGMLETIYAIDKSDLDVQLIIIAGKNKQLEDKLSAISNNLRIKIKVYGFTDQVMKIMSQSDLIITKAGPGSIAEALAMGLPIIINSWLPGQEEGNVGFVKSSGVGIIAQEPEKIVEAIKEFRDPDKFQQILKNIEGARHPRAAIDIASDIISYM